MKWEEGGKRQDVMVTVCEGIIASKAISQL